MTVPPATPTPTDSALIVAVPEAEPVVGRHRQHLDRAAGWGVPAHVTLLYPFLPPDQITPETIGSINAAIAGTGPFDHVFRRVRWFGEDVVWLEPEPDLPFRALTLALCERFPDHPPYGGAHADLIPHLTVGHTPVGDLAGLRQAAVTVQAELPIVARTSRILLVAGSDQPGSWHTLAEFVLTGR